MRIREFFMLQSSDVGFFWKYQMLLGVLLVLTAMAIVLLPEILVVLAAAGILAAGAALISSAWQLRRLRNRTRGLSISEMLEW